MIKEFVNRFEVRKAELRARLEEKHPDEYKDLVILVTELLSKPITGESPRNFSFPDPKRVHQIDDGDYQGTLVFIIAAEGYLPRDYWYVRVSYGSCSGCDILQDIRDYDDGKPSESQVNDYMALSLHVVQRMKLMGDEEE